MESQYIFAVGFKVAPTVMGESPEKKWDFFSVVAEKRFEANKEVERVAEKFARRKLMNGEIVFKKLLEVNEV